MAKHALCAEHGTSKVAGVSKIMCKHLTSSMYMDMFQKSDTNPIQIHQIHGPLPQAFPKSWELIFLEKETQTRKISGFTNPHQKRTSLESPKSDWFVFLRALKQRTYFHSGNTSQQAMHGRYKCWSAPNVSPKYVFIKPQTRWSPALRSSNMMIASVNIYIIYGGPPTFLLPETAIFSRKELLYRNFPSAHIFFAAPYLGLCMGKYICGKGPPGVSSHHTSFCGSSTSTFTFCLRCWSLLTFISQFWHFHPQL